MRYRQMSWLALLLLPLILTACDSFSLLGLFKVSGELTVVPQKTVLQQNEPIAVSVTGGYPPYSCAVLPEDVFNPSGTIGTLSSNSTGWQFAAGTAIGISRLRVEDNMNNQSDVLVTIIPPTPDTFSATKIPPNTATLNWTFTSPSSYISGYELWRSDNGGNFAMRMTGISGLTTTDAILNSHSYAYRLYSYSESVSGAVYRSAPIEKPLTL